MSHFYFFKNDGTCNYIKKEFLTYVAKYLRGPVLYKGKNITFYCVLEWIYRKQKGANLQQLKELGINYINTLDDLPESAGVYITGYDLNLDDFDKIKEKNIPYIERPCPWIKQLRIQLLSSNTKKHQLIFMIQEGHMVYDCYKSRFPNDIIIINNDNYKKQIKKRKNKKPVQLLVYAAFRQKDVLKVIDFIKTNYPHIDNILDGYKKTLCIWTKQGLFREIDYAVQIHNLNEIWIICSSEKDTSTKSIIRQVNENNILYIVVKSPNDIPNIIDNSKNIGILFSPIPLPNNINNISKLIKKRFKNAIFIKGEDKIETFKR